MAKSYAPTITKSFLSEYCKLLYVSSIASLKAIPNVLTTLYLRAVKMPIEFTIDQDREYFAEFQVGDKVISKYYFLYDEWCCV